MDEMEQQGVLQVATADANNGGSDEVVQVIMQEDGQIVMPEGQFIQVNTDDGQPQFIQVTGENGENQLIQLMPDGQAHLVHVQESQDGNTHIFQVGPESMNLAGDQGALTIVNVAGDAPQAEMTQHSEETEQHLHLQVNTLEGVATQQGMENLVLSTEADSVEVKQDQNELVHDEGAIVEGMTDQPEEQHTVLEQHEDHPEQTVVITAPGEHHQSEQLMVISPTTGLETEGTQTVTVRVHEATDSLGSTRVVIDHTEPSVPRKSGLKPEEESSVSSPLSTPKKTPAQTPPKKIDMNSPIPLTTETIVVVNGKKCVLRVDPDSNHLVAYPFTPTPTPGKRGRGRPRKVRVMDGESPLPNQPSQTKLRAAFSEQGKGTASQDSSEGNVSASDSPFETPTGTPTKKGLLSEQENSAAEGLLGLSEDGVRRSRRKRKRASFLTDYEMGAVEGMEEEEEDEDSKEGILEGTKKPRLKVPSVASPKPQAVQVNNAMQTLLMNMGFIPKKRGRGRPRRNPLPTPPVTNTGPIPAFIIPQAGGNAVMMAPIQNMDGLQQKLISIRAKPTATEMVIDKAQTPTSIVIENSDGSKTQIITTTEPQQSTEGMPADDIQDVPVDLPTDPSADPTSEPIQEELVDADPTDVQPTEKPVSKPARDIMDSGEMDDDVGDPDYEPEVEHVEEDDDEEHTDKDTQKKKPKTGSSSSIQPAAIIQLPDNLVPLLLPKKTPVKIGLKATESELEKLKCPRCDFQAYYQQQFQEHLGTHSDDIHKCKCCNFLTFNKDGLLDHFREAHPKCICGVCDFMAEHAYIIKRHMMRHNADGCECNLCGKRYKDQYILKMHVKMVHMPAEVLYECQVCTKKFTRKAHLKRHLRIHEPEKPYKCSHCDYRGCERSDITKHLLIHEEPRHICEVCGKAFRHIKNKELHVKRHKGQRDYKCGVCDFYGYTFTDIRKHIERKHSDTRNILCDKCGSAFKNDALLREHQRRQCELLMFEASLPVEEEATDGQQTIHIPADQLADHPHTIQVPSDQLQVVEGGQQHIMVDGNHVNITVEHVALPGQEQLGMEQVEQQLVVEQLETLDNLTTTAQEEEDELNGGGAGGEGDDDGGGQVVHHHVTMEEELEEEDDADELEEAHRRHMEANEQLAIQEEISVVDHHHQHHHQHHQQGEEVKMEGEVETQQVVGGGVITTLEDGQIISLQQVDQTVEEEQLITEEVQLSAEQQVQHQIDQAAMEEQVIVQQDIEGEGAIGEQLLIELVQ